MQPLVIEASQSTPEIRYDQESCILKIAGESYPENSFHFYAPINNWIKEQLAECNNLKLDINISYMNSSSTKCMLDILDILEDTHSRGGKVSIIWRYDSDNPRSLDLAEEFKEEVTFPFIIKTIEESAENEAS